MPQRRAIALIASVTLFVAGCQSGTPGSGTPPPTPGPSAADVETPAPSPEPTVTPYAGAGAVIPLAAGPRGVAVADGAIWVASTIGDRLQRVDPATNQVVAEINVGARPVTLVTVDGRLWVSVLNGDPSSDDEVVRIDTHTNTVDLRVTVPVHHNIAASTGAIWVLAPEGELQRVDVAAGTAAVTVAAGSLPVALTANQSAVFGLRSQGIVWRWPIGGGSLLEAELGASVPGRSRVAANAVGLWVAVPGRVVLMDPASLEIRAELSLPEMTLVNDLFVTDADVWLSANLTQPALGLDGGSVLRLDPMTLEIRATFPLGPESSGVAIADGSVWAVDQSDDVLARYPLPAEP